MIKLIKRNLKNSALLCAVLAPLCMVLEVFMDLQQPALMSDIIDIGVASGNLEYVLHTGGRMIVYALLGVIGGAGCSVFATFASTHLGGNLRSCLFSKVQTLSFSEIDKLGFSSLITRLTNDVMQMQLMLETVLRGMTRGPLLCIGGIAMAWLLSPDLTLVLWVALPILIVCVVLIILRTIPMYTNVQKRMDGANTVMRENLLGVRVVKAFIMEAQQFDRFTDVNEALTQSGTKAQSASFMLMPVVALVMNFSVVAVLWFGGNMVMAGTMSTGKVIAFVNYMVQIANALTMLANQIVSFSRASASAARICEVFDIEPSIAQPEKPRRPQDNSIHFRDVSFRYSQGDYVLRNLNFSIPQGQRVGIIGPTGSGKSTLVHLLVRLYDVSKGSIVVDDADVREISLEELRGRIGLVLQDSLLFSGTVAGNLRYGDANANDEQMWSSARAAQAYAFLVERPAGLDSQVEQRGRNFSGGQKQRLSIARTLVNQPGILILDDAASALDLTTEAQLRKSIAAWIGSGTLIIITQRISGIIDCDTILVLDKGQIVAQGTHEQLLRESDAYREIAISQLGEEAIGDG